MENFLLVFTAIMFVLAMSYGVYILDLDKSSKQKE
jgi:hypothetical protein